ncbi:unnamed protein product [Tenebrio molitor]|nr:unnamed protein product [Tenebrio molitor]
MQRSDCLGCLHFCHHKPDRSRGCIRQLRNRKMGQEICMTT